MEKIANFLIITGVVMFIISRTLYILNYVSLRYALHPLGTIALLIGIIGLIIKKRNNN